MALVVKDRVKETTTSTGTGTITLAGATQGYQSFSVVGNGNTTYYTITNGTDWEVGIGTYTASGTTLSRDTILESSNAGAAVNFGAGVKDVFVTYPAEKAVTLDGVETLTNKTINGSSNTITNVSLTTGVTGTLPVANGGTGLSSTPANGAIDIGNGTGFTRTTLTAGTNISITNGAGSITINATDQFVGTVTSVAASGGTTGMTFSGSPITTSGTLTLGGTLNVANGGTGASSLTSGYLLKGNGTSAVSSSVVYDNGTNVGIGTSSPGYLLHGVQNGNAQFWVAATNVGSNSAGIGFENQGQRNWQIWADRTNDALQFGNNSRATTNMVINSSGNVGIGTSSPGVKLDVIGTVRSTGFSATGTTAFQPQISVTNWAADATGGYYIFYKGRASGTTSQNGDTIGTMLWYGRDSANALVGTSSIFSIQTAAAGAGSVPTALVFANGGNVERMRIANDGTTTLNIGGVSNTHQFNYNESGGEIQLIDSTGAGPILIDNVSGLARFYKVGSGSMSIGTTSTGVLAFNTNSAERMRIDSSGNVLFATTSTSASNTGNGLVVNGVNGSLTSRRTTGANQTHVNFVNNGVSVGLISTSTTATTYNTSSTSGITGVDANTVAIRTSSTERMRIDSSGRVGIGTSVPGYTLDVVASSPRVNLKDSTAGVNWYQGPDSSNLYTFGNNAGSPPNTAFLNTNVGIGTTAPNGLLHLASASPTFYLDETDQATDEKKWRWNVAGKAFILQTTNDAVSAAANAYQIVRGTGTAIDRHVFFTGASAERMRIDSSGNVGIGTTAPAANVHVASSANTELRLQSTSDNRIMQFICGSTSFDADRINFNSGSLRFNAGAAELYRLQSTAHIWYLGGSERMRMDSSGRVGIGTSSPASLLHVKRGSNATEVYPAGTWATRVINATDASTEHGLLVGNRWAAAASTVFEAGSIFGGGTGSWYSFYKIDGVGQSIWSNAGTERMRLDTSGNLGIGTSSPGTRLDVAGGSIRVGNTHSMQFRNTAGTGVAYFTLQNDDNFVVYNATGTPISSFTQGSTNIAVYGSNLNNRMNVDSINNATSWTVNGSERARINSSGEFLVGTTTGGRTVCITASDNWMRFSNASRSWLIGPSTGNNFNIYDETAGLNRFVIDTTGTWIGYNSILLGSGQNLDNKIEIGQGRTGNNFAYIDLIGDTTYTDFSLRLLRGNTGANAESQLYHRGTGPFSIGCVDAGLLSFATSSLERMRITSAGNVGIGTTTPNAPLAFGNTVATNGYDANKIRFYESGSSIYGIAVASGVLGYRADNHIFYTNASSPSERMRVNSSGNVGIGTSSPASELHVNDGAGNCLFSITSSDSSTAGIEFGDQSDSNAGYIYYNNTSNFMSFRTNGAGEDMRIGSNGGVAIGGTGTDATLHIQSAVGGYNRLTQMSPSGTSLDAFNIIAAKNSGGVDLWWSWGVDTSNRWRLNQGVGFSTNGLIMDDVGNLTVAQNVTAYSDARLKKNVETIDSALDLVSKMRGVRYTRTDTDKRGVGVIAQEMLEVLPEVVQQGVGDDDTLSVAYGNLVGVLIEAVKELTIRVAELEGK